MSLFKNSVSLRTEKAFSILKAAKIRFLRKKTRAVREVTNFSDSLILQLARTLSASILCV